MAYICTSFNAAVSSIRSASLILCSSPYIMKYLYNIGRLDYEVRNQK